jgi:hypothetical protein
VATNPPMDLQHQLLEGKGDNYTFLGSTSLTLHAHTFKSEWIIDFGCTHNVVGNIVGNIVVIDVKDKGETTYVQYKDCNM